ncbi:MAG: hypothetical protein ACU0A9_06995 [Alterinioella nitratireducens]|uniref:hypothetical protein n=1 Tax=Alterinioella nitratireducens TaxID=2735915 RepID=UPI00405824B1
MIVSLSFSSLSMDASRMGRGPEDSQGLREERFPPDCAGRDFPAMAQATDFDLKLMRQPVTAAEIV